MISNYPVNSSLVLFWDDNEQKNPRLGVILLTVVDMCQGTKSTFGLLK